MVEATNKLKERHIYSIATFFITIISTLILYAKLDIAPFGDNTLMLWDMQWQYSSFLAWIREVILGNADWKYTFIGGYGGNAIGLISYYLASPLNLLLIFFDLSRMPLGILVLTLIKSGLMAAAMQGYLYNKRNSLDSVWFGLAYALSSYVICYQSNIMWMDGLILLPFVVRGIEKLVDCRQGRMYVISLGLAIVTNYYIGYMLCIFSVVYFGCYLYICKRDKVEKKMKQVCRFIYYSLIAGGLSGFLILPTIYTLSLSSNKHMLEISELLRQEKILEYKKLLPFLFGGTFNSEQGIVGQYPLVYCGSIFVFLTAFFFVSPKIKLREKVFYAIIVIFLLISFGYSGIYLIWHGCYEPVGSPWRFSFLWVFIILSMGYIGLENLKDETQNTLWAYGILCGIFAVSYKVYGNKKLLLVNFLIIALIYMLIMISSRVKEKWTQVAVFCGIVLLLGGELIHNGITIHQRQFLDRYEKIENYDEKIENVELLLESVDQLEEENSLYRVEIIDEAARNNNDGYLYNENTLTMYSSTEKAFAWNLFYNWGWGVPGIHAKYNNNTTNLARSISGIKYILSSEDLKNNEMELIEESNGMKLYKNKLVMPAAFLVNRSALDITNEKVSDLAQFQNDMYHALVDSGEEDIYQIIRKEESTTKNKFEKISDYLYTDGIFLYNENIENLKEAMIQCSEHTIEIEAANASKIKGIFKNETKDEQLVCFTVPYEKAWKVTVDGTAVETYEGMGGFLLVPIEVGQHVIEMEYEVPLMFWGVCLTLICVLLLGLEKRRIKL